MYRQRECRKLRCTFILALPTCWHRESWSRPAKPPAQARNLASSAHSLPISPTTQLLIGNGARCPLIR